MWYLLCSVINILYYYNSTFRSRCAVPSVAVLFFLDVIYRYVHVFFFNDFEMVADALLISGMTFVFIFHTCRVSLIRSSYRKVFSAFFSDHVAVVVCHFYLEGTVEVDVPPPLIFGT